MINTKKNTQQQSMKSKGNKKAKATKNQRQLKVKGNMKQLREHRPQAANMLLL